MGRSKIRLLFAKENACKMLNMDGQLYHAKMVTNVTSKCIPVLENLFVMSKFDKC